MIFGHWCRACCAHVVSLWFAPFGSAQLMLATVASHIKPAVSLCRPSVDRKQPLEVTSVGAGDAGTATSTIEPVVFTAVPRFGLDNFDAARRYLRDEGYVIIAS